MCIFSVFAEIDETIYSFQTKTKSTKTLVTRNDKHTRYKKYNVVSRPSYRSRKTDK